MIIVMLAGAMTVAMLTATALSLHEESRRAQHQAIRREKRFGIGFAERH